MSGRSPAPGTSPADPSARPRPRSWLWSPSLPSLRALGPGLGDYRVILRLPDLQVLDAIGAQALSEIIKELEHRHITVLLKGPREPHRRILETVGAMARLAHANHVFDDLDDAIAHARHHVARAPHGTQAHVALSQP